MRIDRRRRILPLSQWPVRDREAWDGVLAAYAAFEAKVVADRFDRIMVRKREADRSRLNGRRDGLQP